MQGKSDYRKVWLLKHKKAAKQSRFFSDKNVCDKLQRLLIGKKYKKILLFIPFSFEPNIYPALKLLRRRGMVVLVPYLLDVSFKMVRFRLPLIRQKHAVMSATNSHCTLYKIDAAVVPAIGVDGSFRRIGMGKGMYDRFFDRLGYRPKILFVQRTICHTNLVITEPHDIMGDALLTAKTIFSPKGVRHNGTRNNNHRAFSRGGHVFCNKKT